MSLLLITPFFLLLLFGLVVLLVLQIIRQRDALRTMLMGLGIMLLGTALVLDTRIAVNGLEYTVLLVGFAVLIGGFCMRK